MPKDIMHWVVAEKAAAGLRGTRLGNAALAYPNALKMGAVFPDMPLYLTGRSGLARVARAIGNAYHGIHGEDTYDLPRTLLNANLQSDSPALLAFLAGVACHLQTDIAFHPLVFFLTGDYNDPDPGKRSLAVRAHRRFEVLLDLHLCHMLNKPPEFFQAHSIWKNLESRELLWWTKQDTACPRLGDMFDRAIKKYLVFQRLFSFRPAVRLADRLDPFLSGRWREVTALFYRPAHADCQKRFTERLDYQHPVTGARYTATVDELMGLAVAESIAMCNRLETALDQKDPGHFSEAGPSLDFAVIGGRVNQARHFAKPLFFSAETCSGSI